MNEEQNQPREVRKIPRKIFEQAAPYGKAKQIFIRSKKHKGKVLKCKPKN